MEGKNDYLYICDRQIKSVGVNKYVDKRIWKMAEIVAKGFEGTSENLSDLITSIQLRSNNSDRAKLFILHILVKLVGLHKKQPIFASYSKIVTDLMKLDFSAVSDGPILELKQYS